jgi:hypothetical protein
MGRHIPVLGSDERVLTRGHAQELECPVTVCHEGLQWSALGAERDERTPDRAVCLIDD